MIKLSMIKAALIFFIMIFISENPVSTEFELNEFSENIRETEESAESESEESFKSENKYIYTGLVKSLTPFKIIFRNFLGYFSNFNSGNLPKHFNSGHFFFTDSYIHIYPDDLQYPGFFNSFNSIFVNISYLKQLRISKMRC